VAKSYHAHTNITLDAEKHGADGRFKKCRFVLRSAPQKSQFTERVDLHYASSNGKFLVMKRRALRITVLLWLGWYLSGPVCETFDFWDPPRAEVHDIQGNAGGAAVIVAAIFCFALFLIRKLRERCFFRASFLPGCSQLLSCQVLRLAVRAGLSPPLSHSPPLAALRI
jgi:hypothetical protein